MLERAAYLASLRADIDATVAVARECDDLSRPVEACPGWDITELLVHTGGVFSLVTGVLGARDGPRGRERGPQDDTPLVDWFAATATSLVDALDQIGDGDPCWNWAASAPQVGAFWVRRMAQEAAVHRFDAELAATGTAASIDDELASDGIDEFVDVFLPRLDATTPPDAVGLTLHLHAANGAGEWSVRLTEAAPAVTRDHTKADVALNGPAGGLLLALWGRIEPGETDVALHGDPAAWTQFHAATAI